MILELSGLMDHEQYESLLDAMFELYDRVGMTGPNRPQWPVGHKIQIEYTPSRENEDAEEWGQRIRDKIAKFILSLRAKPYDWFVFTANDDILYDWEPYNDFKSLKMSYIKGGKEIPYQYHLQE